MLRAVYGVIVMGKLTNRSRQSSFHEGDRAQEQAKAQQINALQSQLASANQEYSRLEAELGKDFDYYMRNGMGKVEAQDAATAQLRYYRPLLLMQGHRVDQLGHQIRDLSRE